MVAVDLDKLRAILAELERLAAAEQLTTRRYFELAADALVAAGGDETLLASVIEFGARLSPDWRQLQAAASEVARLGEQGALTPARFDVLYEQARLAVGERTELLELFPEFRGRQ